MLGSKNFLVVFLSVGFILIASFFYVFGLRPLAVDKTDNGCGKCLESSGKIDYSDTVAYFEGKKLAIPEITYSSEPTRVLGESSAQEKWIEVDLSEQKVRAWEGDRLFLESLVSTGLPGMDTPTGEYRIWMKLRATKMEGGSGRYYYYLPNVPYVMFFQNEKTPAYRGYSLHGTYWHNDFGKVHSHGCVNLPTEVAKQIYYWSYPTMPDGKGMVRATDEDPGTRIVIHV